MTAGFLPDGCMHRLEKNIVHPPIGVMVFGEMHAFCMFRLTVYFIDVIFNLFII